MIFTTNHVITIKRLVETSGEKQYTSTITTGISVYIEPLEDDVGLTIDGEGAFNVFKMFTDYDNIVIGDKLTDEDSVDYKVRGIKSYTSLVGKHKEIIIQSEFN